MKIRVLLALAAALSLLVGAASVALGEDAPTKVQTVDSIPTAWAYAALGVISAAGATLGGVIGKIYFVGIDKDKALAAQVESSNKAIAAEKDARREEVEKLLREHSTLLREVLIATNAKTEAYGKLAEAVAANTKAINDLIVLVGQK